MNGGLEARDAAIIAFFKRHPERLPQLMEMRDQLQAMTAMITNLTRQETNQSLPSLPGDVPRGTGSGGKHAGG